MTEPYLFSMSAGAGGEGGVWALPAAEGAWAGREANPCLGTRHCRSSELGKHLRAQRGAPAAPPGIAPPELGLGWARILRALGCQNHTESSSQKPGGRESAHFTRVKIVTARGEPRDSGDMGSARSPGTFALPVP